MHPEKGLQHNYHQRILLIASGTGNLLKSGTSCECDLLFDKFSLENRQPFQGAWYAQH